MLSKRSSALNILHLCGTENVCVRRNFFLFLTCKLYKLIPLTNLTSLQICNFFKANKLVCACVCVCVCVCVLNLKFVQIIF